MKILLAIFLLSFSSSVFADSHGGCISGDCINGYGTAVFDDGNKYIGDWKNNYPNGQGTVHFLHGNTYIGVVKNGKIEGPGTLYYTDGGKYVGDFKNQVPHGLGVYTYPDGTSELCIVENAHCVEALDLKDFEKN